MTTFLSQFRAESLYINPMYLERLPDKLLMARYNYLKDMLNSMPEFNCPRSNIYYVKTHHQTKPYSYKRVYPNSPDRGYYEQILAKRGEIEGQLLQLEHAWQMRHGFPIPSADERPIAIINTGSRLSMDNFNMLTEYSNPRPIETNYIAGGKRYRSRLELHTAEALSLLGLEWRYEPAITLGVPGKFMGEARTVTVTPDFAVAVPELRRFFIVEALGMLSDKSYAEEACNKIRTYAYNGIYPSKDLVLVPGDSTYMPPIEAILSSLVSTLEHICSEVVSEAGSLKL